MTAQVSRPRIVQNHSRSFSNPPTLGNHFTFGENHFHFLKPWPSFLGNLKLVSISRPNLRFQQRSQRSWRFAVQIHWGTSGPSVYLNARVRPSEAGSYPCCARWLMGWIYSIHPSANEHVNSSGQRSCPLELTFHFWVCVTHGLPISPIPSGWGDGSQGDTHEKMKGAWGGSFASPSRADVKDLPRRSLTWCAKVGQLFVAPPSHTAWGITCKGLWPLQAYAPRRYSWWAG